VAPASLHWGATRCTELPRFSEGQVNLGAQLSDTLEEPGFWQAVFSAHRSPDVLEEQSDSS